MRLTSILAVAGIVALCNIPPPTFAQGWTITNFGPGGRTSTTIIEPNVGVDAQVLSVPDFGPPQHHYSGPQAHVRLNEWRRANPGADMPDSRSGAGRAIAAGQQATAQRGYYTNPDRYPKAMGEPGHAWRAPRGPADPGIKF